MRILIIGAGLIGLTSAWALRRSGHEVTIVDRAPGPGLETSFANGALLTPSMSEPWNAPGSWKVLLSSLGRSQAPLQLRARTLPKLLPWGIRFLWNSRPAAYRRNSLANLRLALSSLAIMADLREETGVEYERRHRGSLRLYRDQASLDQAASLAEHGKTLGLWFRILTRAEVVSVEPALVPVAHQLSGAIHYLRDETGDAYRFCVGLAEYLKNQGVSFHFDEFVTAIQTDGHRAVGVLTQQGRLAADRFVVAAGSEAVSLLRRVGLRIPVAPAKGYSLSFNDDPAKPALSVPLIDDALHAVLVPMTGVVRAAGTAEFAGFDRSLDQRRVENLSRFARAVLPEADLDPATASPWCGLRAMSADGVPAIGGTPLDGLYLNTGHGHLGWTMAAGSAALLAALIEDRTPELDPSPYAYARF